IISKKLEQHCAAVSLYVAHYNLCRVHETLRSTPAQALGVADRVWTIGDLLDAALPTQPITPVTTAPHRRKRFRVVEAERNNYLSASISLNRKAASSDSILARISTAPGSPSPLVSKRKYPLRSWISCPESSTRLSVMGAMHRVVSLSIFAL